jgi:hypothetical protein
MTGGFPRKSERGRARVGGEVTPLFILALLVVLFFLARGFARYAFRGGLVVHLLWLGLFVGAAAEVGAFQR